ncbi:AraC family transcriptional regulator [Paraburkholderia sp. B3]|uniref:AraC family transcriptional regulator n=1 Tax=Paraburkholderia sp. B3 TaxID=3134791 RepID=UPI003981FBCB
MRVDPLSEILTLVRARHILSGDFWAGGAWAIRFPVPDAAKFAAIVEGACWLRLEGLDLPPVRLETGDVILLNGRHALIMSSELDIEPTPSETVFADVEADGIAKWNGADEFYNIGGHLELDDTCANLLLDALPPLIHLHANATGASALQWMLHQLIGEMTTERPGTMLASSQLAQLMLVHILRGHLDAEGATPPGWLQALRDKRITTVLRLMHGDPSHPWVLEDLAKAAAMSRTNFALRFKELVGVAPLTYLAQWRMRLAVRALIEKDDPLSDLALSLGYTSESAFSNAFKRIVGIAPKRYRSQAIKEAAAQQRQAN